MLVMLTDRGHILLQKKEDILSVLSNPSLEKRTNFDDNKGYYWFEYISPDLNPILRLEIDLDCTVDHVIQSI